MSTVVKTILILSLALTLSLALFGCGEGLTQEEIEQIVADAVTANAEVNTVKFDYDIQMAMDVITPNESLQINMVADSTGSLHTENKEMWIMMDMAMDMPDQDQLDMAMEAYIIDNWMYMKMAIPEMGEQWMKMMLTEEMWESQNHFDQQIELLRTAKEVDFLGSEDVNGISCYVVEIVPDMAALFKLASLQQMPGMENLNLGEFKLDEMLKEMSVKVWIAKDSYLQMKADIHMLMEISAADIGATEEELEKMVMDIDMEMILYDYNEAVVIELPEEALQAAEMPRM